MIPVLTKYYFTITAIIHARSLTKFYGQYVDRHMNQLKFVPRVSERERPGNSTICYRKKTNWYQFLMLLFCYWQWMLSYLNNVKVVCGSTRLSPRGSTATLTMLWRNSWSITGQTHKKKLTSIDHIKGTTMIKDWEDWHGLKTKNLKNFKRRKPWQLF